MKEEARMSMTGRRRGRSAIRTDDLPTEAELFRQIVITVETAWQNRLSRAQVDRWLSNFTGQVFSVQYERHLALWLLCNFVYYNENEVRHLCRTAYRELLHFFLSSTDLGTTGVSEDKVNEFLGQTRFYHAGRPGESGAFVLYYFRQENNLGMGNFLTHPDKLPADVKFVVFVDDVVLSGDQAERYLKRATADYDEDKSKVLLTFFSTIEAEDLLRAKGIAVVSCIKLDGRCKCFSPDSNVFVNHPDHRENCKIMSEAYGKRLEPHHPLGYGEGEYAFGFYYNTPDNTLPIFWSETDGWYPVMKRYEKIYGKGGVNELPRFV